MAAIAGAVGGAILTVPIGGYEVDLPGRAIPACGSFDQSLLFTICHPYPLWIPIAGAFVGAVLGWLIVAGAQRLAAAR